MAPSTRSIMTLAAIAAAIAWQPAAATAQGRGGGAADADVPPSFQPGQAPQLMERLPNLTEALNDLPDPYTPEDNWVQLPDGREWGSTAGADIDPDGIHIWAIDRCGANSCADSPLDPLLKITPDGEVVESFGGGLINFPHGLYVDDDGNVWVTDGQGPNPEVPGSAGKGHTVLKFSPTGELLLTIGTPGVAGNGTDGLLNTPNDVTTDAQGNI